MDRIKIADEYARSNSLPLLTDAEVTATLRLVERGEIPPRQRELQLRLLITYSDDRCVSFALTDEGRAWLVSHNGEC